MLLFPLKSTTSSVADLQLRALKASVLVKGREMGLGPSDVDVLMICVTHKQAGGAVGV